MGKKGNKRKTRWRVLPIGGDNGDSLCSTNDDEGDGDRVSSSPTTPVDGSWTNGRPAFSPRAPTKIGKQRLGYQQSSYRQHPQRGGYNDSKPAAVTTEKKTFNEEEYTKITTPRQDVLFKKGYLGRKKPALTNSTNSADVNSAPPTETHPLENAGAADHEPTETHETPHFICPNGYVDQGGVYYINGGSYELYDPYTGNVTVVVGPAPHGPPLLAAVSCQPVPLQPLEWFNPPFHSYVSAACPDRRKRSSTDSQNWSPQSSESTDPPGSPQDGEDVGLQNGVAEPLEDCTVYQHTHQPPAYVYPGYMFGPAVYNMNGINIQSLPPQPQAIDTSGSKRRKKKRRRRRKRGGVDDGSDESTSDENELEEPVSLTSQESSQEVESDSKTSAESTSCKAGSAETNSSEKSSESAANVIETNSVVLLENGHYTQTVVTNSFSTTLKPPVHEYSGPPESEQCEGNRDSPITNSSAVDSSCRISKNSVNQQIDCHEVNQVHSSKSISESIPVQNSCVEVICNGPQKSDKFLLECNNTANPIDCPTTTSKVTQNSLRNNSDGLGISNAVTTKEKNKGKRSSKLKQKQQHQNHNHTDCADVQVQTAPHKMDGNECSKSRGPNDGADRSETSIDTQIKSKSATNRSDQVKSSGLARVTYSADTSSEPPKKPSRKESSHHQKQPPKKLPPLNQKERKDRNGTAKTSKTQTQCSSEDPSENQEISPEVRLMTPASHSDECESQLFRETEDCCKVSSISEDFSSSSIRQMDSSGLERTTTRHNVEETKTTCFEKKTHNDSSAEEVGISGEGRDMSSTMSGHSSLGVSSDLPEAIRTVDDFDTPVSITHTSVEILPRLPTRDSTKTEQKNKEAGNKCPSSTEERLSPPPIPPPRRKKWHPCNKRPSTERPPTPGRDLEERRSSEVLTDDSSSTTTSRESEESVIEIVSSSRSAKCKSSIMVTKQPPEREKGGICDIQYSCDIASEAQLENALSDPRANAHKFDSLRGANTLPSRTNTPKYKPSCKESSSSRGIAQQFDSDQNKCTSNFHLNGSSGQQDGNTRQQLDALSQRFSCDSSDDLSSVEKFSEKMACRVIEEALLAIKVGKSDQTFSWPITEAVTRWLRSQSTEEVLPIPELRDSENDSIEETEEENPLSADALQQSTAGPKNVLRNPLLALSHECMDDDVGIRVATNIIELTHLQSSSDMTDTSNIDEKIQDINNNNNLGTDTPREMSYDQTGKPEQELHEFYEDNTRNTVQVREETDYSDTVVDDERVFSSIRNAGDGIVTGEVIDYDTDWECSTIALKQAIQVSDMNDTNLGSESPDCRYLHMCDPTLSVAKYYRLGPPADKADAMSQDQVSNSCSDFDEEIDSLEHFRDELYDSAYDSSHRSLADELEYCEKPLPESWSIDQIKISQANTHVAPDKFKKMYNDYKAMDSGIHSEESGTEDSRKPSTNSSNIFPNSKLFNRNSAIHMTGLTNEGPFPCGGICCILQ